MAVAWSDHPIWLDLTRSLSRIGREVGTGIDRVELAYLDFVLSLNRPDSRFLVRTTRGFLLLGSDGAETLRSLVQGEAHFGRADRWSRWTGRGHRPRHRAEAAIRPLALERASIWGLGGMLARNASPGTQYISVGHANLSGRVLTALGQAGATITVMIHDLIPLTHSATVVSDLPDRFANRIETVRRSADLILANSEDTRKSLIAHWRGADRLPNIAVAPLGLAEVPEMDTPRDPLSFVMVGSIEPRKNHALMLDVWEMLAKDLTPERMPRLSIIGPRGWQDRPFFQRLDNHPLRGTSIFELGALPEDELHQQIAGASALLFPSVAEGYGFPPLEALAHGTLPIVSDLPVLRETLGASAVYLPPMDAYSWVETIKKRVDGSLAVPDLTAAPRPTWRDHFDTVIQAVAGE